MAVGKYRVPFRDGSLQHYAPAPRGLWPPNDGSVEWKDNEPFYATIKFESMRSGYSAKYIIVSDEKSNTYPMFVTDTLDVLRSAQVSNGICTDWWCVQKRGQNYGLRLVKPDERPNADQS